MSSRTIVVAGHGMVGQRFLEELLRRDEDRTCRVVVLAEEGRPAYDRVALSSYFNGVTAGDLSVVPEGFLDDERIELRLGDPVVAVDRAAKTVTTAAGDLVGYDDLVLATGSSPFVPPIPGSDGPGTFVYRTLDDLEAIERHALGCHVGAVVGGGLLGLEAANALRSLGLETHVVEFASRLMPVQLDEAGAAMLQRRIEDLGVFVHTATSTTEIERDTDGALAAMAFADGTRLEVDVVVFSAGIRPRDELARAVGLPVGERGGVTVDEGGRTADPSIWAIGECADIAGRTWGLVAPGNQMAAVAADRLLGGTSAFTGADLSTKLKLLGVDVASFGDAFAATDGASAIVFADPRASLYKKLVVAADGRVLGGMIVGDATASQTLLQMARGDMPTPPEPERLLLPAAGADVPAVGVGAIGDDALICSCNSVTKAAICGAVAGGCGDAGAVKQATRAGSTCGGCVPLVTELVKHELRAAGVAVRNDLCEHFPYTRQELFDLVRVHRITSFGVLLRDHGRGLGCEVCKPAVASMFASLGTGYVLEGERASLQDTNDHFLANLQRDGTYSVVPRVPGGEITPEQLIAIGEVARDFGLYT
jgi:nitrite reductase (NADH) large subunit